VKRLVLLVLAFCCALAPRTSFAQVDPPSVSSSIQPREVEVGETFIVTLTVTVDSSTPNPTDPALALPDGLRAGAPSVSSQTQISIVNGHMSRKSGISATWQVVASREGTFGLGPPSVMWSGRKIQGNGMRVVVHPATPGGRQRHANPSPSPFDPFGGLFPRLPNIFDTPTPEPEPEVSGDPEIALDTPLDSKVFLRAVVDQKSPVVGEQVTLTVYVYARPIGLDMNESPHEPSIADFYRRELLPPHNQPEARPISIGGVIWRVQPIYKAALFPLRSGDLEIGPMQATFVGRGSAPLARASQAIKLRVAEPPAKGRPVGYQLGDVGSYSLTATVDPRKSEVGGAVAVTVQLSGVGNVPNTIRMPTSAGFEWLEPQMREDIEVESGKVKGSRTFSYVARPKVAGSVDLGEVTLPYWNPDRKVYDIARAYLGKIEVAPGAAKSAGKEPDVPHDPWASLGKERDRLGGYKPAAEPLTERPFYWLGLFGAPLAVVATSLGSDGVRRLRRRFAARRRSAERGIDQAMAEARTATKSEARAAALGPLERAIYLSIERVTGLKARALLLDDIPAALEASGLAADVALEIKGALALVEAARFAPDAADAAAPAVKSMFEKIEAVVRKLGRMPPSPKKAT
jgi:hypothetical protein